MEVSPSSFAVLCSSISETDASSFTRQFIQQRLFDRNSDGSLQIMYTIRGEKEVPEFELDHLLGHKGSKPVRIGNGAGDHLQLE